MAECPLVAYPEGLFVFLLEFTLQDAAEQRKVEAERLAIEQQKREAERLAAKRAQQKLDAERLFAEQQKHEADVEETRAFTAGIGAEAP